MLSNRLSSLVGRFLFASLQLNLSLKIESTCFISRLLKNLIQQMSDDKADLNLAVLDIINALDRFTGSGDPSVDFQPIVFTLFKLCFN